MVSFYEKMTWKIWSPDAINTIVEEYDKSRDEYRSHAVVECHCAVKVIDKFSLTF